MSIETERSSCPHCSTQLQSCYISLSEKMLICTKRKCDFPFDVDDISPYIIKVDSLVNNDNFAEPSSSLPSLSPSSPVSPSSSSSSSLLETPSEPTLYLTKSMKPKSKSHSSSSTEEFLLNPIRLSQTRVKSNGVKSNEVKSNEVKSNGVKSNGVKSNGVQSNGVQSIRESSNLSNSEFSPNVNIELTSIEPYNSSTNPKSINSGSSTQSSTRSETLNLFNKVIPEETISNSNNNNTITLKTLGVTLKVDQPNKNKSQPNSPQPNSSQQNSSQPNSSQFNELSTDMMITASGAAGADDTVITTVAEKDLTPLFNMNDFPVTVVDGSSANTTDYITGNGLLNANTTGEIDSNNTITVEEYSKMLFGQSDIDINFDLDNMLPNFNTMDIDMQGNDTNMGNMDNMDLDELLGTYNSLEPSKVSGNEMNLDFDSFMASLGGGFTEANIPNDMSGNNLNVDSNTVLVNTNGMNGNLNIYTEMINGNSNEKSENNSTLDLTYGSVNGQNGYHENIEKIKDGVVEDEGKNVVGKID